MSQPESDGHRPARPVDAPLFALETRELEPGVTELALSGQIDLAAVEDLTSALTAARDRGGSVLVDLRECTFMDSSGLALFVRTGQELAERGGRLFLHGCHGQTRHVLEITGLRNGGLVEEDREAALSALRADAPT